MAGDAGMNRRHAKYAWASGLLAGVLAIATGGMAMAPPDGPVRMSNLRTGGLAGFDVIDSSGIHIGEVISVDKDRRGRARWVTIALEQGGEVRLASFRAWLDAGERQIALQLPEDIVLRLAEADELNSLSAGI
jgi:hypothetical protein